tara:strand:+ start:1684 stop:2169 length:486 start_codon:yes stop_codon:yes gene_type:complete
MKTYKEFIAEYVAVSFDNWVKPSDKDIELEYKVEYEMKGLGSMTNDAFPTVEDFKKAVKAAKVISLTSAIDRKIEYRSRTRGQSQLLSLIKSYRSYPEFRNEKTLQAIYDGFRDGKAMKYPFILEFPDGRMRIMSGNTRTDVAIHSGITPKALLIKIPAKR